MGEGTGKPKAPIHIGDRFCVTRWQGHSLGECTCTSFSWRSKNGKKSSTRCLFSIVMIVMILNHAWKSFPDKIFSVLLFTWRSISMKRISFTRNVYRTFTCHLSPTTTRKRNDTLLLVSISHQYSRAVFAVCDVRIEKYSWYYVRCQRRHCMTSWFDVILIH